MYMFWINLMLSMIIYNKILLFHRYYYDITIVLVNNYIYFILIIKHFKQMKEHTYTHKQEISTHVHHL